MSINAHEDGVLSEQALVIALSAAVAVIILAMLFFPQFLKYVIDDDKKEGTGWFSASQALAEDAGISTSGDDKGDKKNGISTGQGSSTPTCGCFPSFPKSSSGGSMNEDAAKSPAAEKKDKKA
eukprot:TRINITY_DN75655_c0_g1_i1.p3 TRINITY_DN75655_c0_g1~~TRINITY_DN75655_c0_g1_i1.p3  ORF type:complete len:123 (-),score=37.53 TRINITY_DN75655_c0_g1_i1:130-498(-)